MVSGRTVGSGAQAERRHRDVGGIVASGIISMVCSSRCWLTFWLTPASRARGGGVSTLRGGTTGFPLVGRFAPTARSDRLARPARCAGCRPQGSRSRRRRRPGPAAAGLRPDRRRPGRVRGDSTAGSGRPTEAVGAGGSGPGRSESPPGLGFESRLNNEVRAQIAMKLSGTMARISGFPVVIHGRQSPSGPSGLGRPAAEPSLRKLTGSRRELLLPVPAIDDRISVSAWTFLRW